MNRRAKARALCATLFFCAAVLAYCWRVVEVNRGRVEVPTEVYRENEWLGVGSGFMSGRDLEDTEGYVFRMNSVELMTPDEYLSRYAKDGVVSTGDADGKVCSLVVYDVTVKNDGNGTGGVNGWLWQVVPPGKNDYLTIDEELFSHVQPELGGSSSFSIPAGTSYTTQFPFTAQRQEVLTPWSEVKHPPLDKGTYLFVLTNLPSRKLFAADVR